MEDHDAAQSPSSVRDNEESEPRGDSTERADEGREVVRLDSLQSSVTVLASAIENMQRQLTAIADRQGTKAGGEQSMQPAAAAVDRVPLQPPVVEGMEMFEPAKQSTVNDSSGPRELSASVSVLTESTDSSGLQLGKFGGTDARMEQAKDESTSTAGRSTEQLVAQLVHTMAQPRDQLPTFGGKCRNEYGLFIREFHRYLEDNAVTDTAKLRLLIQACTGEQLKKRLKAFVMLEPKIGYEQARKMLDSRLGGVHHHVEAAVFKLTFGPAVGDDADALEEFMDDLWDCMVHMKTLGRYNEIDNFLVYGAIATRLTGHMRDRYEKKLMSYEIAHGKKPNVEWMRDLLKQQVDLLRKQNSRGNPPEEKTSGTGSSSTDTSQQKSKQVVSLATAAEGESGPLRSGRPEDRTGVPSPNCRVCMNKGQPTYHPLHACKVFRSLSVSDRIRWSQVLRLCYCCLRANHRAKDCRSRAPCGISGCGEFHSRLLHPDREPCSTVGARTKTRGAARQDDLRIELNQRRGGRSVDIKQESETQNKRRRSEDED